ncbi:MAG: thiamine-phosphate kinase [Candidatus Bathyarchaeota archaeon]|nr:thiamine-phosphate kinase [Candidatus Bathyarchaeota archaeon]
MALCRHIGERKVIEILTGKFDRLPNMPIPFGDDVSAYPLDEERLIILKTDMLVGGTDIPPGMSLWQAARKAVVMNVSDFAAKGVKPLCMLVSLGLPRNLTVKGLEEIGEGLNAGAREYGSYIVGGDTNEASDLVISLSVFGIAKKGTVITRRGAKPGDIVAVTGLFGKTSAGLKMLLEGFEASREIRQSILEAIYMPKARLDEGLSLALTDAVTASIDSSDGLAWSLHEISVSSNVGFLVDNPPLAPEAKMFADEHGLDPLELMLYGGEEYELVLTINPLLWSKAEDAVKGAGGRLIPIGRVTAGNLIMIETQNERRLVAPRGWEHFKGAK